MLRAVLLSITSPMKLCPKTFAKLLFLLRLTEAKAFAKLLFLLRLAEAKAFAKLLFLLRLAEAKAFAKLLFLLFLAKMTSPFSISSIWLHHTLCTLGQRSLGK
nr:hypothetical protein [Ectobacillus panaciterrae]